MKITGNQDGAVFVHLGMVCKIPDYQHFTPPTHTP